MRTPLSVTGLAVALALSACAHGPDAGAPARQAVIESNMPELQACWDDLAGEHPGVGGSLLFEVDLRRNGSVEWVDIAVDQLGIAKLSACTVRRIKNWRFPEERKRRSISFGVGFRG
ncbi:AgmX/PglI C-terminal domain-containing protein [Enhygromyxa salina]|uniref:Gram-negative bacterial tonB protein n=1 Tax=Enhygromyxa salina TaxID=215803 RepID=A0A2S9Y647_9BACT|nr:AgmX/PglI C-terminal domain-containing protein [Enhygromyxa salina]PRQ00526.1 hypothetical protein ENSA7_60200 [Enhygromyxa salina]